MRTSTVPRTEAGWNDPTLTPNYRQLHRHGPVTNVRSNQTDATGTIAHPSVKPVHGQRTDRRCCYSQAQPPDIGPPYECSSILLERRMTYSNRLPVTSNPEDDPSAISIDGVRSRGRTHRPTSPQCGLLAVRSAVSRGETLGSLRDHSTLSWFFGWRSDPQSGRCRGVRRERAISLEPAGYCPSVGEEWGTRYGCRYPDEYSGES